MHSKQMNIVSCVRISKRLLHKLVRSEAYVVTIKPAICVAWELERQFIEGGGALASTPRIGSIGRNVATARMSR